MFNTSNFSLKKKRKKKKFCLELFGFTKMVLPRGKYCSGKNRKVLASNPVKQVDRSAVRTATVKTMHTIQMAFLG